MTELTMPDRLSVALNGLWHISINGRLACLSPCRDVTSPDFHNSLTAATGVLFASYRGDLVMGISFFVNADGRTSTRLTQMTATTPGGRRSCAIT